MREAAVRALNSGSAFETLAVIGEGAAFPMERPLAAPKEMFDKGVSTLWRCPSSRMSYRELCIIHPVA